MAYRLLLTIQAGEAWEPSKSKALAAVGKHVTEENLQFCMLSFGLFPGV